VKKSSFCLALCFSCIVLALPAQSRNLEFYFSGSRQVRSLQNNLLYQLSPLKNSLLSIRSLNSLEQRISFDQNQRRSSLELELALDGDWWRHHFLSGYEYLYDRSALEQELHPYVNRTGFIGYRLELAVLDSLRIGSGVKGFLRREEDRYLLDNQLGSEGYELTANAGYGNTFWQTDTGVNLELGTRKLDWEFYESAAVNAYLNHLRDSFTWHNNFSLSRRRDKLYVLGQDSANQGRSFYSLHDTQSRYALSYTGSADLAAGDWLQLTALESYSHRLTDFDQNIVRNNADYLNLASLQLVVSPWQKLNWQNLVSHSYAIKDFSFTRNTRHTEIRSISSNLSWEYAPGDSLTLGGLIDLQRTTFPDDANRWDNDLRNRSLRLGNTHYWKQRIKLSNRMIWNIRDDIYTGALLSSNNKVVNSLSYSPECDILIGDRLLFKQEYQIRVDYTKYLYEYIFNDQKRSLYRQLAYKYSLVFDSFPFTARSGDLVWMKLPYRRGSGNAFLTDFSFAFEQNDYADYDTLTDIYVINFKNRRYITTLTLKHDIQDFYYIIQPRYSWGTWTEYNLLLGLAWQFNNLSLLEISVNPTGEKIKSLDWRTSISLNLQF